jgi:glycosyltransferase involved in cell wall biosynthesis
LKKVVILSNDHSYTYNLRKEIIQRLITEGYRVYVVFPYGEKVEFLKKMECIHMDLTLDKRGMNIFKDIRLTIGYYKIINKIKPDIVLSYTVKPNVYGGTVCRFKDISFFPNVTGLGTALETKSFIQKLLVWLYRFAFKKARCVFFQNNENQQFFIDHKIRMNNYRLIPGSGVNLNHFNVLDYPPNKTTEFVFISRIMKEKGIEQYLQAAEYIRERYPNTRFHACGFCEESYENRLKILQEKGIIQYHGMRYLSS